MSSNVIDVPHFQDMDQASSSVSGGLGRLPSEEDDDDFWSVPDNAAGNGFAPMSPTDRWLDTVQLQIGDCKLYAGEACREYLNGRFIMITSENREDVYDIG